MDCCLGPALGQRWWGLLVGLCSGQMLRPVAHTLGAVQDSTHEYVGGERITVKKS